MNAWERDSCIPEEDAEAERSKRPASADILRATKRLSCAEKRASNAPDADACGSSPPVKHSSTEYTVRAVQQFRMRSTITADFGVREPLDLEFIGTLAPLDSERNAINARCSRDQLSSSADYCQSVHSTENAMRPSNYVKLASLKRY